MSRLAFVLFGLCLALSGAVPGLAAPVAAPLANPVIVVDPPTLAPAWNGNSCTSYWITQSAPTPHGTAYYTQNVNSSVPQFATNSATWTPNLPQAGYYKIEVYIPQHPGLSWPTCFSTGYTAQNTADARYVINHSLGQATVVHSQHPADGTWRDLGTHLFNAGVTNAVTLRDLNDEANFSKAMAFSAIRFTYVAPYPASLNRLYLPIVARPVPPPPPPPSYVVTRTNQQAFDACFMPTLEQLQTWWDTSPYRAVNLYLGGSSYAGICFDLTPSYVQAAAAQGWSFIPTWVGPQAPCSGFGNKFSGDPATAYQQGRNEADAALAVAQSLGLTPGGGTSGTLIYYDLESYSGASTACRNAAASFINGWSERLRERGNQAGAYGTPCTSYMGDWATIANPPDHIWMAWWLLPAQYRPTDSVPLFGAPCNLHNTLWSGSQRLRQYAGDHGETWGNVRLNIDSNVLGGGVVDLTPGADLAGETDTFTLVTVGQPLLAAESTATASVLLYPDRLLTSLDAARTTVDITPALPTGAALTTLATTPDSLWLAGVDALGQPLLVTSADAGDTWSTRALPAIEPGQPVSLSFPTADLGYLAIQHPTRAIFSRGTLLTTTDGGVTWSSSPLPLGEPVVWSDARTGWQAGGPAGTELYVTRDAGQTWTSVTPAPVPAGQLWQVAGPVFTTPTDGTLTVTVHGKSGGQPLIFATTDAGRTWSPQPATLADSALTLPAGATDILWLSASTALAPATTSICTADQTCTTTHTLYRTADAGVTWQTIRP